MIRIPNSVTGSADITLEPDLFKKVCDGSLSSAVVGTAGIE